MRVAQHHPVHRGVHLGKPVDGGQGHVLVPARGQWPAQVQHDAVAVVVDLDAVPADLVGAPVDPDPHQT